ncbi:porin [Methylobacterium sp. J-088]|uniref:porin n=1 Tax=unclassified Methylobacterium TaxID=2615210 RepID=UPI001FBB06E5|nr:MULTISPECIES: porin [unclassified Methylobacterium]MCJ2066989.1 porin [Methylobacterium sp. J-088]
MPEKLLPPSLLAALLLSFPAFAAELQKAPVAPGPVPCPSKGQGFVRLPGSDSCVRISGRVTAGTDLRVGHAPAMAPLVAGRLAIDNRADTDLGEVRTYVRIGNGRR